MGSVHNLQRQDCTFTKGKRPLHVLTQESQDGLVAMLILLLDLRLRQVPTRRHKSVDLVLVPLNKLRGLQIGLVTIDSRLILVHRGQQRHRNRHGCSVFRVHHGRMALHRSLEVAVLARGQGRDLAAPAVSQDGPTTGESTGWVLLCGRVEDAWDAGEGLWWRSLGLEEVP